MTVCGLSIKNANRHTWIFALFTLMANSCTLCGVGISRAGSTAGWSWLCTVGTRFAMETFWCVGHPWRKMINQLLIINRKKWWLRKQMFGTPAHNTLQVLIYLRLQCFLTAQVSQHCPPHYMKWFSNTAHCFLCSAQPAQVNLKKMREEKKKESFCQSCTDPNPTEVLKL